MYVSREGEAELRSTPTAGGWKGVCVCVRVYVGEGGEESPHPTPPKYHPHEPLPTPRTIVHYRLQHRHQLCSQPGTAHIVLVLPHPQGLGLHLDQLREGVLQWRGGGGGGQGGEGFIKEKADWADCACA
jgi:hypothetical protein